MPSTQTASDGVRHVELRCRLDRGRDLLRVAARGEMGLAPGRGAAPAELTTLGRRLELLRIFDLAAGQMQGQAEQAQIPADASGAWAVGGEEVLVDDRRVDQLEVGVADRARGQAHLDLAG